MEMPVEGESNIGFFQRVRENVAGARLQFFKICHDVRSRGKHFIVHDRMMVCTSTSLLPGLPPAGRALLGGAKKWSALAIQWSSLGSPACATAASTCSRGPY
jgi:hypothetical protein